MNLHMLKYSLLLLLLGCNSRSDYPYSLVCASTYRRLGPHYCKMVSDTAKEYEFICLSDENLSSKDTYWVPKSDCDFEMRHDH